MPTTDDIRWFKEHFATRIAAAVAGTPFSVDLLVALACQETGGIWSRLRRARLGEKRILELCVGDTIDARADGTGRRAFPRNKAALLAEPGGEAMFAIAREALVEMAQHVPEYQGAAGNASKFCRGFGIFQRDLQFFREDPEYFLQRRYADFDATLGHALQELSSKQRRIGLGGRGQLSVLEMVAVTIAYNTGRFDPAKGLNQGFRPKNGKFYGQAVFDFLRLSETVAVGDAPALIPPPDEGQAILPPPSPVTATGPFMRVDTRVSTLLLRSQPRISRPPRANVVGELPDGHPVRAIDGRETNGFMQVETSLFGALLRGFASTRFLVPAPDLGEIPVIAPVAAPEDAPDMEGLKAAHMPRRGNAITRRSAPADAHSLNEPRQPSRRGSDVDTLRRELGTIVAWLDSENPAHKRYLPRDRKTFCNIYCHDFCHLAGVYLPRVWWSSRAVLAMARGEEVQPLIGDTINEVRANDLFRWLRDFGPKFGWRQTGTLTKLQLAANQGAIGLIVARRKNDGLSGHIVMVVPETDTERARRDGNGDVVSPLQSQAGAVNFRYGTAQAGWWNRETFAEHAFWVHA